MYISELYCIPVWLCTCSWLITFLLEFLFIYLLMNLSFKIFRCFIYCYSCTRFFLVRIHLAYDFLHFLNFWCNFTLHAFCAIRRWVYFNYFSYSGNLCLFSRFNYTSFFHLHSDRATLPFKNVFKKWQTLHTFALISFNFFNGFLPLSFFLWFKPQFKCFPPPPFFFQRSFSLTNPFLE